ncbi:hypothetical protein SI65_00870 [Aspergillus cristatus]|uniref:non-specific serine/threonine protein kinase n=1 Tax=Aspergillus cristatus TaxID=573508 RepID=A0A1E3BR78_ASPCR|nr:hypothetical protein SI65_00870 [Aspergillus cristatus]
MVEFDVPEPETRWRTHYMELLGYMRVMYQTCHLVHADLSEYNILYHKEKLYIIDVSQSVEHDHPRSLEFLRMDIKKVSDFFRRKGVDPLPEQTVFKFIISPEGPTTITDSNEMFDAIEKLFEACNNRADQDEQTAEAEVDTAVFRQQYIPQTLEQVYDIERDIEKVHTGKGSDLVYHDLLAKHRPNEDEDQSDSESEGGVSMSGGSDAETGDENAEEDDKKPCGKRFLDKDTKREHKQKVKEEKQAQREKKMPKHMKKRMVASSSRKKKIIKLHFLCTCIWEWFGLVDKSFGTVYDIHDGACMKRWHRYLHK